ncbi:MAG: ubiquitin-conjugating enzyme E2 [Candidatus Sericytochromatia bacterium]|nr:ubiquitin-conjugating enzyme E2 [Candidatus Sericytochromatia bacterium]
MEARRRRLEADDRALKTLGATRPGLVELLQSSGQPPESHLVRLHIPGIEKVEGDTPVLRQEHRVEIRLPASYPLAPPVVRMLSPVFHPHVFTNGTFCLGARWLVGESLGDLMLRLVDILRGDPALFDFESPADPDAALWYEAHPELFPLAEAPTSPAPQEPTPRPRLEWRES